MHILQDADYDCASVLDDTPDADIIPDLNVADDADDFPDVYDNPDAVLDINFPLITLEENDGNVVNGEVSNVPPSSNVICEAVFQAMGETFLMEIWYRA